MSLGLFNWLLVIPKLGLLDWQQAVFGGPNWTRLNVLKNSVRNCKPNFSPGPKFVVLNIAKSQLLIPFATKRGVHARLVAETKVAGSREAIRVEPGDSARRLVTCAVPLAHPGTTFGRS